MSVENLIARQKNELIVSYSKLEESYLNYIDEFENSQKNELIIIQLRQLKSIIDDIERNHQLIIDLTNSINLHISNISILDPNFKIDQLSEYYHKKTGFKNDINVPKLNTDPIINTIPKINDIPIREDISPEALSYLEEMKNMNYF